MRMWQPRTCRASRLTSPWPRFVLLLHAHCTQIYTLESAVRSMPEHGDGKTNIIIDYQGWTLRNSPPLRTTKETISILQNQYPERLHKAYLYNPPGIFSTYMEMTHLPHSFALFRR